MSGTESSKDSYDLDPVLFASFERTGAQLRGAEARLRAAEAREAEQRADFEPERQRLVLLERKTKLAIGVLATLFSMVYLVGALLLVPWILPPTGIAAALAFRWR